MPRKIYFLNLSNQYNKTNLLQMIIYYKFGDQRKIILLLLLLMLILTVWKRVNLIKVIILNIN
jgi:F0F1-type ATP synthase assembly protein I